MVGTLRSNFNIYYGIFLCHDNLYFYEVSSKYRNFILPTKIMETLPSGIGIVHLSLRKKIDL